MSKKDIEIFNVEIAIAQPDKGINLLVIKVNDGQVEYPLHAKALKALGEAIGAAIEDDLVAGQDTETECDCPACVAKREGKPLPPDDLTNALLEIVAKKSSKGYVN